MTNRQDSNPRKIKSRIASSLVLKLNLGMLRRFVSSFLLINLLIISISTFVIAWKVEESAYTIINTSGLFTSNDERISYNINNYQIHKKEEVFLSKGSNLPRFIEENLPFKVENTKRNIKIEETRYDLTLGEKLDLVKYNIRSNLDGNFYEISYSLGSELRLFLRLFLILLIFELLIILGNLRRGAKSIRKTLKPLADLAETAKSLNAEVSSKGLKSDGRYIEDLAGVISGIDANKLDSRISVDSSQNELKDLASAINDMLNRINNSYQSQIRFVSDASHELRTPISVIQGYANLLDRWGKNDEATTQESIDAIKSEAESMKALVEQLLFLARGDNESIQFHKEKIDVCEIMDEIIKETQMIDSDHVFEVKLSRPAYIDGDKQLIKQAIRILVDNSVKYTPSGEKITLKIVGEDDLVRIIVQDSGIGIEGEHLAHTFDRFYRSDESRARKTGGSGLGLSIAKWIVEQHNGYFEILSRLDIGTRITIVIDKAIDDEGDKFI